MMIAMTNPAAPAEHLTRADGSPLRVLVVDDEVNLRELLATVLRYEGWQVESAADGHAALKIAKDLDPDVVVLDVMMAGGDDYVTKPFSLEEVVARLRALMRRSGALAQRPDALLVVGDLTLDEDSHEVRRDGEEINLTATEFELLRYLMRNPKRVLSKAQILDRVWQYDFGGQANIVELYISYLRRKIDAGREPMIHTLRGAGYVLKPVG